MCEEYLQSRDSSSVLWVSQFCNKDWRRALRDICSISNGQHCLFVEFVGVNAIPKANQESTSNEQAIMVTSWNHFKFTSAPVFSFNKHLG
jgi:hypothetical protein